jgi:hypothetical protein
LDGSAAQKWRVRPPVSRLSCGQSQEVISLKGCLICSNFYENVSRETFLVQENEMRMAAAVPG